MGFKLLELAIALTLYGEFYLNKWDLNKTITQSLPGIYKVLSEQVGFKRSSTTAQLRSSAMFYLNKWDLNWTTEDGYGFTVLTLN